MPQARWQREANATRAPRLARITLPPDLACGDCGHLRPSHSLVVLTAACRHPGCGCDGYDPTCACGHRLVSHLWGTPGVRPGCAECRCAVFTGVSGAQPLKLF